MFVASRVEGTATAAMFPQIIGRVQTAIGHATLTRAYGIAVEVMVGDPVCLGDAIETATDGRIGIRFIDSTVFNLSGGTRVVFNEFLCDSSGAPRSALFSVTRGAFAFISGDVARTGSLKVDTPFGSIRGRAHAGGFGMLSLAALTFAMMKDVHAADPNATWLDDDSITYKDLAHGAFELVTKELIPRHIIVDDPGETVVLNKRGSSVSVDQFTNSAARMEELHAAQQEVLDNYAKEHARSGSGVTPNGDLPLAQPINFTETDDVTVHNVLLPILSAPIVVPDVIRSPPTLSTPSGPTENDTVVFDAFTATSGTFAASSTNGNAILIFGISGGIAVDTVLNGITYNVSKPDPYGTLYLNSSNGDYTFVPNSDAINALKTPTVESFIITVSDGSLSTSQTFTITINGVNDAAFISGTANGSATEAGGVANAAVGTTASGTLTDTDVDDTPNTFTEVSSKTSEGGYGTFSMTTGGTWTYTVDNANSAVQKLNVGDTLTDQFTVTSVDGTPKLVTVTIHGVNDAAVISGATTGAAVEAGGVANAAPGTPTASGSLTDTDVDNASNSFKAVSSPTASAGGYGKFTISADGAWTYTVDNANSAVQKLNVGDTLIDKFTVTTIDGTPQEVTVTIHGANDAAIISGTTTGCVIEAGGVANYKPGMPTASGTLTDTDIDNAPNTFAAVSVPKASAGGYGTFTITAAGEWAYTLDNSNSAVQALNVCDKLTDTFTVTTIDGTPQVVTITIQGSNDAAVISGATTGSVTEATAAACDKAIATGTLTDADVDNASNCFTPVSCPTESDAGYGTFTMTAAGAWIYKLDSNNCTVQALNACDTLTDTFTVTTIDGTSQVVTITIHGANDPAVISGTTTGCVIEAGGVANCKPGEPIASGTLTDTDVDNPSNTFTEVCSPTKSNGGYGTFTMTACGVWSYTLDNANCAVQALNVCDTLTDTFTVTTIDGTPQVVTITIQGSNDAAVVSGTTTGAVTETGAADCGNPIACGALTDTDVDNTPNTFTAVSCPTASDKGFGTFTMTAAGEWTYKLDNTNCTVEALNACDTLTDTFTVTTIDGTKQVVTITIHGANDSDPNDFDFLATGTHVVSDPPHVYGTPGHDSIAGGGAYKQIVYAGAGDDTINGTSKDDVIYGGSGNDIIKGNGGNDTIYGGSGNDTIKGNYGCDTIVGGFGADWLTGSNGNDRFVYLSAADSNAAHFDTITDFQSGCDKIDLSSLGAFAFAALTPSSTSVPEHAVAWLCDSANNVTIVYANPTDQALKVGDCGLVEIHLAGTPTVQASDFVTEPAAAAMTDNVATTTAGVSSAPTEFAAGLSENSFTFDQTTPQGSAGTTTTDSGAALPPDQTINDNSITAPSTAAAPPLVEPAHTDSEMSLLAAPGDTRAAGDTFHFKDVVAPANGSQIPTSVDQLGQAVGDHEPAPSETLAIELSQPVGHSADHSNVVPSHTHASHDLIL
ncbi:VCBS domain-containing protein [Bradyrhizobium lablabi]|uniref:VCBS domain-containing protein n=1 Tax=Bradyrhizobium lablabi TaxID=722472 RepID=UPI001BA76045|nr:VCBS domain-containing protein [Bradyrhizobium lablabi]MBR0696962.1 VCBS domain-containing protein [Bradyrhizobium lablabi]